MTGTEDDDYVQQLAASQTPDSRPADQLARETAGKIQDNFATMRQRGTIDKATGKTTWGPWERTGVTPITDKEF